MPIVGIDLGTTNCALASIKDAAPEVFEIPQLVKPGDVQARPTLPSFVYLTEGNEFPDNALDLPWATGQDFLVGEAARERGAQVPLRMINSAKSWLCHAGVDRRAPILPQQAPEGTRKLSPVAAEVRYIEHLKAAWDSQNSDQPLTEQQLFITVPASFDAVARDLTMEAAREAGLENVSLLEEPQAAFYAWLARVGDDWREQLTPKDRVLVCDVGGGTSDFSLIEVKDDGQGNLHLERIAVGDHLLLGGDNMDLALAHHLMQALIEKKKKLDAAQQRGLVASARAAKEKMLSDASVDSVPITVLGSGRKLIGGQIKTELTRAALERVLVEGFFPECAPDAKPAERRTTGFMELGLPFVADAAITRHLAAFVAKHCKEQPVTHVLFNGGVFNSPLLQKRLLTIIGGWGESPKVLEGADNDLAVAKGAAYFGAVKAGSGIRIRGGVARSYYIGIESAVPAVPGVKPPISAMCVVPFGLEEGSDITVPGGQLGLVVGEPVEFRFLSSTNRKDDVPGTFLDEYTWPDHLTETAPLRLTLESEKHEPGSVIPVRLEAKVTDIGTLELWSVAGDGSGRWKLEFNVREAEA